MTLGTEAKHAVPCPRCGALAGETCHSRTGGDVTNGHKARIELYNNMGFPNDVKAESDIAAVNATMGWKLVDDREARVDQILFGIFFARTILHLPQEVIDRNLAGMIVDSELDLKLF
jgi:hypothetical protein